MKNDTLMLLTHAQADFAKKLEALELSNLEIIVPETESEIKENIKKTTIILGNPEITKNWINEATNVTWMQSTFAGIDSMNHASLRKDYILTNVKDVFGKVMTEYIFSYILMFEKEILENINHQQDKKWKRRTVQALNTKTLGILGTGSIGKDVAKIGKAFGMQVVGYKNTQQPVEYFDTIYTKDQLLEMLSQCDYVISILPNTENTNNIIDETAFAAMKKSAVFMNVGRGNAVDEKALLAAIKNEQISKAVLDVFKKEPLPIENELWTTKNIYVTPHMSGNIISDELLTIFETNYTRFKKGEELMYKIDLSKGY